MLIILSILFCAHLVASNNVGSVKVPTTSPWLLTHAFQCLYPWHHQCLCDINCYFRHCWQSYILLYTVHCGSVSSPLPQCLITSHSLPFHLVYSVITIINICALQFCYRSVCGGSFLFTAFCYVHSSSCCINNTPFVATATRLILFTPTGLHVVA